MALEFLLLFYTTHIDSMTFYLFEVLTVVLLHMKNPYGLGDKRNRSNDFHFGHKLFTMW